MNAPVTPRMIPAVRLSVMGSFKKMAAKIKIKILLV